MDDTGSDVCYMIYVIFQFELLRIKIIKLTKQFVFTFDILSAVKSPIRDGLFRDGLVSKKPCLEREGSATIAGVKHIVCILRPQLYYLGYVKT